ncbi:unnamed protein product [Lymnaea stagnalis]|uniref:Uncharacterized protein n=1 Tax=Lymnaea stagnalis TaxID=6523 RepID=A0AAV2HJ56_LYMST
MNAQEWEKLRNHWSKLIQLYPPEICCFLFQKGTINEIEKSDITNDGPGSKQMEKLLFLLKGKSQAYSVLMLAIKDTSGWVAEDIENTDVKSDSSLTADIHPDSLECTARQVLRKHFVNIRGQRTQLNKIRNVLDREGVFKDGVWDDRKLICFLEEEFVEAKSSSARHGIIWISNIGIMDFRNKTLRSKDNKEVKPVAKDNQTYNVKRTFTNGNVESSHQNDISCSARIESPARLNYNKSSSTPQGSTDDLATAHMSHQEGKCLGETSRTSAFKTVTTPDASFGGEQGNASQLPTADNTPGRHDAAEQDRGPTQRQPSSRCLRHVTNTSKIKRQRSDPTFSRKGKVHRQLSSPNSFASSTNRRELRQRVANSPMARCLKRASHKNNLLSFRSQVTPSDHYTKGRIVDIPSILSSKKLSPLKNFHLIDSDGSTEGSERMMEELIKFISACLNDRQNGTVYFGISPSKCLEYELGEIVGIAGLEIKPMLEDFVTLAFSAKQRDIVLSTIDQQRMVPVVNVDHLDLFVIEIDIVPSCSLLNEELFWTKLSAISYNFHRNNKFLIVFSEQGAPQIVQKKDIKNYKRRHVHTSSQRLKEETLNAALTRQSKRSWNISMSPKIVLIAIVVYLIIQFYLLYIIGFVDNRKNRIY